MELSKNVIKFVIGVFLTILAFVLSHNLYFSVNPLFNIPFFGQTLFAFAFGAFGVIVLPVLAATTASWVEFIIRDTALKAVSEFWDRQEKRALEAKKKKEEEILEKERLKEAQKESFESNKALIPAKSVVLDTSAIIDGRLLDVVKTGFLDNTLVVPRVVIEELQLIADSDDNLKRQRGRRGLDMLKDLKKATTVVIKEKEENLDKGNEGVDRALIKIAKAYNCSIATVDFNLNKVASVSGIKVLNVNELANSVKTVVIPGDTMNIKIIHVGKDATQGVGYLADGTMIVIEKGSELVGADVSVSVSRVIQTQAGKMIFTRRPGV
ncbi:MAG: PIN domain-containing protein [Patescibacteria group bacterium]